MAPWTGFSRGSCEKQNYRAEERCRDHGNQRPEDDASIENQGFCTDSQAEQSVDPSEAGRRQMHFGIMALTVLEWLDKTGKSFESAKNMFHILSLLLVLQSSAHSAFAESTQPLASWDDQAARVAESSPRVQAHLKELRREARKIQNRSYRDAALEILDRPRFSVVDGRRAEESAIITELKAQGLLDSSVTTIFPKHSPMRFVAAPASFWTQHHTYPGGLVFHTLTNLRIGIAIAEQWHHVYGTTIDRDLIRLAPIWHDSAKTLTLAWNRDGTASPTEGPTLGGTAAHHIWGVAEAIYRGLDPRFVVILASAHSPANGADRKVLVNYLRAGAIIAGKPFASAGLLNDGSDLASPPVLEGFLHHLSDHDHVVTQVSMASVRTELSKIMLTAQGAPDYWGEDRMLSRYGDLYVYQQFLENGIPGLKKLVQGVSRGE